jgi:hypothetical protein
LKEGIFHENSFFLIKDHNFKGTHGKHIFFLVVPGAGRRLRLELWFNFEKFIFRVAVLRGGGQNWTRGILF